MRRIAIAALLLLGCSRKTPPPEQRTPAVVFVPSPIAPTASAQNYSPAWQSRYPKPKPSTGVLKKLEHQAPIPLAKRCIDEVTDGWASLQSCLRGALPDVDAGATDAGHKLMSGGSRPATPCPAQLLTDWYFDIGGDNKNTCADAGHPCFDPLASVESRYACGGDPITEPDITTTVLWHFASSSVAMSFRVRPQINGSTATFGIVGAATTTGSGTFGTVTPKNNAASQFLNIDLGSGAAGHFGDMIVRTSDSSWAWVDFQVSGNVMQITQPTDASYNEVDNWTAGQAFTYQSPNPLYFTNLEPKCGRELDQTYLPEYCAKAVTLSYARQIAVHPDGPHFTTWNINHVYMDHVRVDGLLNSIASASFNSEINQSPHIWQDSIAYAGSISNPFITGTEEEGGSYLDGDVVAHGTVIFPPGSITGIGALWGDPNVIWYDQGGVFNGHVLSGSTLPLRVSATKPTGGNLQIFNQYQGSWNYAGSVLATTAAQSFGANIKLITDMGSFAFSRDFTHTPTLDSITALTSPLDLDDATKFPGGMALNSSKFGGFYSNSFALPSRTALVFTPGGPCGGDLCGTYPNCTVCGFQSVPASAGATTGQMWQLNTVTPSSIAGLELYLDSDLGVTQVSSKVSAWLDQSSHAYNFTQATSGNRFPYVASGGLGGHGYLDSTLSSNESLLGTVTSHAEPFDLFVVIDKTSGSAGIGGYLNDFGMNDHLIAMSSGNLEIYNGGANSPQPAVSNGGHVVEAVFNAGASLAGVDGTQTAVSGLGASTRGTSLTIGNYGGGFIAFGGRMYAYMMYDHQLSTSDRNALCGFISARWGVTCAGGTSPSVWSPVTVGGDVSIAVNGVATLASVGSAGSCGSPTSSCALTFDAKGRETARVDTAITFPASAVTSVTGAGSTSCSPTTGAVVCTSSASGITSVTGTNPINCTGSPTANCSLSTPLSPAFGGDGVANPTAHTIPVAQAGSAFNFVSCGNNLALIGNTSADPSCQAMNLSSAGVTNVLGVGNGGTGGNAFSAGQLIQGNGGSALSSVAKTTLLPHSAFGDSGSATLPGGDTNMFSLSVSVSGARLLAHVACTANGGPTDTLGVCFGVASSTCTSTLFTEHTLGTQIAYGGIYGFTQSGVQSVNIIGTSGIGGATVDCAADLIEVQ